MKKAIWMLGLLPLTLGVLSSCGCDQTEAEEISRTNTIGDTIIKKNVHAYIADEDRLSIPTTLEILFKKGGEVPYVSLKDGFRFLTQYKKEKTEENTSSYTCVSENETLKVNNDNGSTCLFNPKTKTIEFDDFHAFTEFNKKGTKPLPLYESRLPLNGKQVEYTKGKKVTLDLSPYPSLDIYVSENEYYLPLHLFNDIFLNNNEYVNLAYNLKDVFLVPYESLAKLNAEGEPELTRFGKQFYGGTKKDNVSKDYAKYYYDELVFNFDAFYGLKENKGINSFDAFLTEKGYKEDLLSGDVYKMDASLDYALSELQDGHSNFTNTSPLYKIENARIDRNKENADHRAWEEGGENNKKKRALSNISLGTEHHLEDGITYITFDEFSQIDAKALYGGDHSEALQKGDSNVLFADLYKNLTTNQELKSIKTIVIDLTCNFGGSVDSQGFILNTLIGEATAENFSPLSQSINKTTIVSDINLDGKIDSNDKSLRELGYNIVFLNSKQTYSSGNALTVLAKQNASKVITIGQNSGGGAAVLRPSMNALGSSYSLSGIKLIGKRDESGKFSDVEKGVAPDINVEPSSFYDRKQINQLIKSHLEGNK